MIDMTKQPATGSANLTVRQLEVFAMASRSPSFSEAAKRLGISQPSLSAPVAKIEQQLGWPGWKTGWLISASLRCHPSPAN
jgi:LysR family carnitine catabolism transcriptional activator